MHRHHIIHTYPSMLGWQHHMENSQKSRNAKKMYES